ncbi:hypothetical protein AB0M29_41360 [Streptomyces sp. NPDC051976]|uniref:hypothetical protein n=1 Tax=Streptomyces sp. NPDC051976 TaxID=3154947 RepID=UPI003414930C
MTAAINRTDALRHRRDQSNKVVHSQPSQPATGRPADLVITADMIPDPPAVDAAGDLSHTEIHDLGVCEWAVDHLATARWLAGKALQSIRDRKLYRQDHRTFEEYVQDRWEMSERAAYQAIEEWPLAERLQQTLDKPVTPSHTRALLPISHRFGLAPAVDLYQQLAARTRADGLRLTAALTTRIVHTVLERTGTKAEAPQFLEATRQLMSAEELPTPEPTRQQTSALPRIPPRPSDPDVQVGPSLDARRLAAGPDLQNFTEGHEHVTEPSGLETPPPPRLSGSRDNSSDSPSPQNIIHSLEAILQKVRDVEEAIDCLAAVDPFHDGLAEDLRREIHRRLLRAAEPYKPFHPRP